MAITHGGDLFAVAREHGWNWRDVADFSANINPLGPAPGVRAALCEAIDRIEHYPEREPERLRQALAQLWQADEDQILLGNGATELIFFFARALPPTRVTLAVPVFSEFHRAFPAAQQVKLTEMNSWPQDGLLVLTRPANPTGWSVPAEALQRWLAATTNPVLMDESFLEFSGLPSALALNTERPNLFLLRSLTKFYALPGLRVGALIGPPATLQKWREQREPWQVNVLAEAAALAAIQDQQHSQKTLQFVEGERQWLFQQLQALPKVSPEASSANFLYAKLGYPAKKLAAHMLARKVLIRDCGGWPGITGQSVRIAVRRREENERLLHAWKEFPCA